MKAKKRNTTVLLIINAVLLFVFITQVVLEHITSPKTLLLRQIDSLIIEKPQEIIHLSKQKDAWTISLKNKNNETIIPVAEANGFTVQGLERLISEIRVLSVASSGDREGFGFDDSETLRITGLLHGKPIRVLEVGNNASLANQTYIKIDGAKEISLVSGDYRNRFNLSYDEFIPEKDDEHIDEEEEFNGLEMY